MKMSLRLQSLSHIYILSSILWSGKKEINYTKVFCDTSCNSKLKLTGCLLHNSLKEILWCDRRYQPFKQEGTLCATVSYSVWSICTWKSIWCRWRIHNSWTPSILYVKEDIHATTGKHQLAFTEACGDTGFSSYPNSRLAVFLHLNENKMSWLFHDYFTTFTLKFHDQNLIDE